MNLKFILLFVLPVLFLGCVQDGLEDDQGLVIYGDTEKNMGQTVRVNVANDLVRECSWSITDAETNQQLTTCSSMNSCSLECTFDMPGEKVFALTAVLNNNEQVSLEKSVFIRTIAIDTDNPPVINATLTQNGSSATFSTIRANEAGEASFSIGSPIHVDLTASTDENQDSIVYQTVISSLGSADTVHNGSEFDVQINEYGYYNIAITLRDINDKVRTENFDLIIACPLSINNFTVSETPLAIPMTQHYFYNYDASSKINRASGFVDRGFQYMWDFNGDGKFDTGWVNTSAVEEYASYAMQRSVRVKVRDNYCPNHIKEAIFVNSNLTPLFEDGVMNAGIISPILGDYNFIQGVVLRNNTAETVSNPSEDSFAGKYLATHQRLVTGIQKMDSPLRMECSYNRASRFDIGISPATLTIEGKYTNDNFDSAKTLHHGIQLRVEGLMDDGVSNITTTGAYISSGSFYSDEDLDNEARFVTGFENGQCSITLQTEGTRGQGTCGTTADVSIQLYREIWGVYECTNSDLTIRQGEFSCVVNNVDPCPVGGGGGGGTSPVPE